MMISPNKIVSTSSTLDASGSFESDSLNVVSKADYIVGTLYADVSGTLTIEFDDGSGNWDAKETRSYAAAENLGFEVPVVAPYVRITYDNDDAAQSTFRLNVWQKEG